MKKILFLAFGIVITLATFSQDTWKLNLNGKIVFTAKVESEEKNKLTIKKSDLSKKKDFYLTYTEKTKDDKWEREIMIVGDNDHELFRHTSDKLKISNAKLLSLFKKSNTLKIYTISLPKDPAKRAVVRVRRVHLVSLTMNNDMVIVNGEWSPYCKT
ncbi:MAG: hypothetical protein ACXWV9_01025 [Flavisolibacter sp.]